MQQHDLIDPRDSALPQESTPAADAPAAVQAAPHAAPTAPAADARADTFAPLPVTLFVCTTCKGTDAEADMPPAGAGLLDAVQALAAGDATLDQVAVQPVKCLGNCKRGLSAALIHRDGWTYVFGDLAPDSADDLLTGARLFLTSTDGILPWRGRPDVLKRNMVARVPPLAFSPPSS